MSSLLRCVSCCGSTVTLLQQGVRHHTPGRRAFRTFPQLWNCEPAKGRTQLQLLNKHTNSLTLSSDNCLICIFATVGSLGLAACCFIASPLYPTKGIGKLNNSSVKDIFSPGWRSGKTPTEQWRLFGIGVDREFVEMGNNRTVNQLS